MNWFSNMLGQDSAQGLSLEADAVIVDVRSPMEFASGHIDGAINLPLDVFAQNFSQVMPSKAQQVVLYCRSGARSGQAVGFLQQNGYTKVVNGINAETIASQTGKAIR